VNRIAAALPLCLLLAACASGGGSKVELPSAPRAGEPNGVVGLTPATMRGNFGTPAFVRKDGAMEMWRYDGRSCKAFFFLYPEGGSLKVRHVETIPRGSDMAGDPNCLNAIIAGHRAQPVS
jgi:hypothetical protein